VKIAMAASIEASSKGSTSAAALIAGTASVNASPRRNGRRPRGGSRRPLAAYETTKLLAAVFAAELARRTHGIGITANAADPGFVRTNLGCHATGAFRLFLTLTRPFQSPPRKAAATAIHLATAPQTATATGGYYTRSRPGKPSPLARDPELGHQLWAQSTTLLTATDAATSDELTF